MTMPHSISFDAAYYDHILKLASTRSRNIKMALLEKSLLDPSFLFVAQAAYNPASSYHVKTLPSVDIIGTSSSRRMYRRLKAYTERDDIKHLAELLRPAVNLPVDNPKALACFHQMAVELLQRLTLGRVDDLLRETLNFLMSISKSFYHVLGGIVRKGLQCGINVRSINEAHPDAIYTVPYQRCSPAGYLEEMSFPGRVERKADGMFFYLDAQNNVLKTRNGLTIANVMPQSVLTAILNADQTGGYIFAGEGFFINPATGRPVPREQGNGWFNTLMRNGPGHEDAIAQRQNMRFVIWAMISRSDFFCRQSPQVSNKNISDQLRLLFPQEPLGMMRGANTFWLKHPVATIWSEGVDSASQARETVLRMIEAGEEGGVYKSDSPDNYWRDERRCKHICKIKAQTTCEFILTGAYAGTANSKYASMLGGISYRSQDGLIRGNCAAGFTDMQRKLTPQWWGPSAGQSGEYYL